MVEHAGNDNGLPAWLGMARLAGGLKRTPMRIAVTGGAIFKHQALVLEIRFHVGHLLVALLAFDLLMRPFERKAGLLMVEAEGVAPTGEIVAGVALCGKLAVVLVEVA